METVAIVDNQNRLFTWALSLAVLTVVYNIIEGLVAIYFGLQDETLTLFGFGADSFVETISAIGVTQMVIRIKKNPASDKGRFEVLSLKITGWCFYALTLILIISAVYNLIQGHQPTSTTAGVIIASISIVTMWALVHAKISLGKKLESAPIIADAKCNLVCLYMSLILLIASGLWLIWQIPYIDIVGTMGLVYFSVKEGQEAMLKAKGIECQCRT